MMLKALCLTILLCSLPALAQTDRTGGRLAGRTVQPPGTVIQGSDPTVAAPVGPLSNSLAQPSVGWSSMSCPAGTYDMVTWIVPTLTAYPGTYPNWVSPPNHQQTPVGAPLYTTVDPWAGRIMEIKRSNGYPWDIMTYDANYIYYHATQNDWYDPTYVAVFYPDVPAMPRCANGGFPGSSIITGGVTLYQTPHNGTCSLTSSSFGTVAMKLWGPYSYQLGNEPAAAPTLVLSYQWGTPGSDGVPPVQELEYYQQGPGFVRWSSSHWNGSTYVLDTVSDFSTTVAGGTPAFQDPCGY